MPLSMQKIWVQIAEETRQEQADKDWSETAEQALVRYNVAGAFAWSVKYETQKGDVLNFLDFGKLEPNHNILDLGCGAGWLTAPAKKIAGPGRVVGADYSPYMLRYATEFCAEGNVTSVEWLVTAINEVEGKLGLIQDLAKQVRDGSVQNAAQLLGRMTKDTLEDLTNEHQSG